MNCIVCSSKPNYLLNKDNFDLYKCPNCGLVFVYPQPDVSFLKEELYSYESGYQSNKTATYFRKPIDKKTQRIIKFLVKNYPNSNVLDVGCSSGEFMYNLRNKGFNTFGVELNKRTADVAISMGLNVFNGFLNDAKFNNHFFDVIFLGDIIEHVSSPRDLLLECNRILKKGGCLIISTPNLDCLWSKTTFYFYKMFKIPWSSLTPPYHLYQFSYDNLNILLLKNGLKLTDKFFNRPPRLSYELGSLHLLKKYKSNKSIKNLFIMFFAFSLYTITYCLDFIVTPFKSKDFSMVTFYKKS